MTQKQKFYVTTPIYYWNGIPHVGHFYSSTIANIIYKFHKISGYDARFTTGIDENSQKAVIKAEEEGLKIMDYLDNMAAAHKWVWEHFNFDYTDFIRTTEPRHHKLVQEVLQHCFNKGDIYEWEYEWMYCIWCEAFKKDDDLIEYEGKNVCPDHLKEPDHIKEKNYFFRLKKYQTWMEEFYKANPNFVQPNFRFNEVIAFVQRWLEDFSISRETNTFWIPLPFDDSQVTYVWFDALFNYYTSCRYSPNNLSPLGGDAWKAEGAEFIDERDFWENNPNKLHIVWKDIIRFHAIFWPAMLASYFDLWEVSMEKYWDKKLHYINDTKEKQGDNKYLPTQILAWGFFTVDGQKMSKTIWNVIDPVEYSKQYSKELLTLYMLSAFPIWNDWDYDRKDAILTYNAKLANNFGNLLNRVVVLSQKIWWKINWEIFYDRTDSLVPVLYDWEKIENWLTIIFPNEYMSVISTFDLKWALDICFYTLDKLNKYVDEEKPWELIKNDKQKAEYVLYVLAEWLRQVWLNLYSFFPEKMWEMFERLGLENYVEQLEDWKLEELRNKTEIFNIKKQDWVLFERFELPEENEQIEVQKNIKIEIKKEVTDLGLHIVSAIVEIPKVNNRRSGALKKYIKQELENIDFNNSERVSILEEAQKFYDNSGHTEAMHPSVHLQKLVENSWKLPNINNVVDSYNIESLKSGLSIWVHDISRIEWEDIIFKIATWKEEYIPLWAKEQVWVNAGEYVCMDNKWERIICRMDCKQCIQTLVNKDTKKIFVYIQGNSWCTKEYAEKTLEWVMDNLENFCGAKIV